MWHSAASTHKVVIYCYLKIACSVCYQSIPDGTAGVIAGQIMFKKSAVGCSAVFRDQAKAIMAKNFKSSFDKLALADRLIYGDYSVPGADVRTYTQLTDMAQLVKVRCLPICKLLGSVAPC